MSMENFKELPLEVRLSAFIDGQVGEDDARELEALIASNDDARGIYETLKMGSDFGNKAFEEMLREPVPLDLVRKIKAIEAKPAPVRQAANNNVASFMRFIPQAIAASVMLLFAGAYAGYYVAENRVPGDLPELVSETSNIEAPGGEVKTRGMGNLTFELPAPEADSEIKPVSTRSITKADVALAEVASAHKVYAADKVHADEVPAAQESELVGYLEAVTSVKFAVPDLSAEGYKLRGGKFVEVVGQPTGALFYEDGAGKSVAVYFMKNENISGAAPAQDGFTVIGGQKDATSYFIAAADEALAKKLEGNVRSVF
ncbi:anti-sigma factor family protein [Rhizobium sp. LjRoot254]|uniref:anti-sigma factor family protein n=1 Tax=Rhizobium sp. LjRoot254 TaxID=3342297 RepID=UPI003ECC43FB